MENLKKVVSANISRLRVLNKLTQSELGEKLNYSDKTVSKWERGEAVPDALVLKKMAVIFGVTVDYILEEHTEIKIKPSKSEHRRHSLITSIAFIGVWTFSFLLFSILSLCGITYPMIFMYTVPASLIVLLVLNSVWRILKANIFLISALVWSVLLSIYLTFISFNPWILLLLGIPAQIIILLGFRIKRYK